MLIRIKQGFRKLKFSLDLRHELAADTLKNQTKNNHQGLETPSNNPMCLCKFPFSSSCNKKCTRACIHTECTYASFFMPEAPHLVQNID